MKRVILITSAKGGSGKSTFARGLLDYYRRNNSECAAYDSDGTVGQLLQYYGTRGEDRKLVHAQNPLTGVGYFDLRQEGSSGAVIDTLEHNHETILVDLPGGPTRLLISYKGDDSFFADECKARGYEIIIVFVMTNLRASASSVEKDVKAFPDAKFVAVKNLSFGEETHFPFFDGYKDENNADQAGKARRLIEEHQGDIITMPKMDPLTYAFIDFHNLKYSDAKEDKRLKFSERSSIARWMMKMDQSINASKHLRGKR